MTDPLRNGRYLLFLDILGFRALVNSKGSQEVYDTITEALRAFDDWEEKNRQFRTIYFSDTFIFYQYHKGYGDWAFLDVYAVGGMLLSALLAKGIAARGAISFGEFEVSEHDAKARQIYFGSALIEAYEAEQKENWIGITILPSAWKPFAQNHDIDRFGADGTWLRRGEVILLNPFIKLRGWHAHDLAGEITLPYAEWDAPDFPNDIAAFRFIHDQSQHFLGANDFAGRVASKYHATVMFLRKVMGEEAYAWACKVSGVSLPMA